jgi:hypothetical protein
MGLCRRPFRRTACRCKSRGRAADAAFGLSSSDDAAGLAGNPTTGAAGPAAKHGGIYPRTSATKDSVYSTASEVIAAGERAKLPVDVIHLKIADQKN